MDICKYGGEKGGCQAHADYIYDYCFKHLCNYFGCKKCKFYGGHCEFHADCVTKKIHCCIRGCNSLVHKKKSGYCYDHYCKEPGCKKERRHSGLCTLEVRALEKVGETKKEEVHIPTCPKCMKRVLIDNSICLDCMCVSDICTNPRCEEFSLCSACLEPLTKDISHDGIRVLLKLLKS